MISEIILQAFPSILQQEVEKVIDILPVHEFNVLPVDDKIHFPDKLLHNTFQTVYLDGEELKIPYRLYFNEPCYKKEISLTDLQKTILNCIYLRHHNGFVRQQRLKKLLTRTDNFIIPFSIQLLGEYVIEILEVLAEHTGLNTDRYIKFINDNQNFWNISKSRVISYWNEYYRRPQYPNYLPPKYAGLQDYIGQKIVNKLNNTSI